MKKEIRKNENFYERNASTSRLENGLSVILAGANHISPRLAN